MSPLSEQHVNHVTCHLLAPETTMESVHLHIVHQSCIIIGPLIIICIIFPYVLLNSVLWDCYLTPLDVFIVLYALLVYV